MSKLPILFLLFLAAEVASIVFMADWLGGGAMLLLMVISFALGLLMLRNLGFSSVFLAGSLLRHSTDVSLYELLWPVRYIVAALLLMSPGVVSTLLAALLMLPLRGMGAVKMHKQQPNFGRHDDIIDGEYRNVHPHDTSPNKQPTQALPPQRDE